MKHCKIEYKVIKEYSDIDFTEIIEYKGITHEIKRVQRPCKTESELRLVFVNGVTYSTFAKFLKTL